MTADGGDSFPYFDPATAVGISVAVAGNILISLALNLQKLAHRRLERKDSPCERNALDDVPEGDERESISGNLSRVPSALDLGAESNPWNRSFPSLQNFSTPARTPYSEPETEPLVHVYTPASYGTATPVRERSLDRPSRRRGSLRFTNSTDWQPRLGSEPDEHAEENSTEEISERSYLRSKLWWAGFLLMNLGELGNFISYGFAPASVVAPLGTFALVANCFFAPLIQHEKFRKRDLFGVTVAIVGAVTVVFSAHPSDTRLTPTQIIAAVSRTPFVIFSAVYAISALILITLSQNPTGQRHVLVDVGLCALFGGFTVLATKGVSTLLTTRGLLMFKEWITYPIIVVLIATGIGQIRYLNRALMKFDSKIVIPAQFVLFNLSAIVGSGILYQDFRRTTFHEFVTFLYGCGATFAGVFIIASGSSAPEPRYTGEESIDSGDDTVTRVYMGEPSSARKIHVIRPRDSVVSLVGLSPAQGLLLVHTPQHEDAPLLGYYGRDVERGDSVQQRLPESASRRRPIPAVWAGRERAQGARGVSSSPMSARSDGAHA